MLKETISIQSKLSALIDDNDFQQLVDRFGRFNLFEAVGAVRGELKHSNFLAFLLSASRSHGLGSEPLRRVLRAFVNKSGSNSAIESLKIALADLSDSLVFRERDAIDLLIEIRSLNLVVAIENKVDSGESHGQLKRYKKLVTDKYKSWQKMFVFLTPFATDPSDENWIPFSYRELAEIFNGLTLDSRVGITNDVSLIIKKYVELIRRHVVQGEDLKPLAAQIYEKYREALDFIFEAKTVVSNLLGSISPVLVEHSDIEMDKETPSRITFTTKKWLEIEGFNQCPKNAWTKTGRGFLFEVKSPGEDRVLLSLYVGPGPEILRRYLHEKAGENKVLFKGYQRSLGQQWVTIFSRTLLVPTEASGMDEDEKIRRIRENLETFLRDDLPELETTCISLAQGAPI